MTRNPNHQKDRQSLTLNLYTGKGYFYFVYDNGNPIYADHSVYCYRLNNMSLDQWVDEGNNFLERFFWVCSLEAVQ